MRLSSSVASSVGLTPVMTMSNSLKEASHYRIVGLSFKFGNLVELDHRFLIRLASREGRDSRRRDGGRGRYFCLKFEIVSIESIHSHPGPSPVGNNEAQTCAVKTVRS